MYKAAKKKKYENFLDFINSEVIYQSLSTPSPVVREVCFDSALVSSILVKNCTNSHNSTMIKA